MPEAIDFMRFLATSITFMVHLKDVRVVLDGHCIGRISKFPGLVESVDLPIEFKHSSPSKMMVVNKLKRHRKYPSGCKTHELTMPIDQDSRLKLKSQSRVGNHR